MVDPHRRCLPDWYIHNQSCPHGYSFDLFETTVPHQLSALKFIALLYSAVPYMMTFLLLVFWLLGRSVRETAWLLFACVVVMVCRVLREVEHFERPAGSCLISCVGVPPTHSTYAIAVMAVLLWDDVILRSDALANRAGRAGAMVVLLLPQPWARAQLRDITYVHALWSCAAGFAFAAIWILCLGKQVEGFLAHWFLGVHRQRPRLSTAEDAEVELVSISTFTAGAALPAGAGVLGKDARDLRAETAHPRGRDRAESFDSDESESV